MKSLTGAVSSSSICYAVTDREVVFLILNNPTHKSRNMVAVSKLMPLLDVVQLDRNSLIPLHRQLYTCFRSMILNGGLAAGTKLPSTRTLAKDLEVSRNTVVTAFEQLVAEGFLEMKIGVGTLVAAVMLNPQATESSPEKATAAKQPQLSESGVRLSQSLRTLGNTPSATFQPGLADCRSFPRTIWSRLVARRCRELAVMGYDHAGGYAPLREAIATYLAASRGVRCSAEQVIIVSSAQAGLDLALRMLLDEGDEVWHEEPGYLGARAAMLGQALQINPIAVDTYGIDIGLGIQQAPDAKLIYVTPSHQYPTGVTLTLERRLELLNWAQAQQTWIIEDDYDSEFRYSNRPIAALQGLDHSERVIYLGSFSKTLFPGLKIAYLVVPRDFSDAFSQAVRHTGQEPPLPVQAALYDFIEKGYFSRHIRHMRTLYSERRLVLKEALKKYLDEAVEIMPSEGGLQLAVSLPNLISDKQVSLKAAEQGITAQALSDYYIAEDAPQGFLLGFAATPTEQIDTAMNRLVQIILEQNEIHL